MASNDPGLGATRQDLKSEGVEADSNLDDDHPVAPDQFDPKYATSKWEIRVRKPQSAFSPHHLTFNICLDAKAMTDFDPDVGLLCLLYWQQWLNPLQLRADRLPKPPLRSRR